MVQKNYLYQQKFLINLGENKKNNHDSADKIVENLLKEITKDVNISNAKLKKAEEVLSVVDVTKEEYEKAQKELEDYLNPIMQKLVKEGGGETMPPMPPVPENDEVDMEDID